MLNKDAVVGMLKNYLLPGAYPVAKADIETTIDFIESQERDAEMGRAAERGFTEIIPFAPCTGKRGSEECNRIAAATKGCVLQYYCRLRARNGGES